MDSNDLSYSRDPLLEHAAWVRKLARELVRDPGAADDLAQETWLAFLHARPDEDRPLRPWLGRVLRNAAALRARRRAGSELRERESARAEGVPSSLELVERAEEQRRLADMVLELDEPYRGVLLLRYYEGLGPSEIARAQGVPAATVRTQLHRGLARLRERLDAQHDGDRRAWLLLFQPLLSRPERAAILAGAGPLFVAGALVLLLSLAATFALLGPRTGAGERGTLDRGVADSTDGEPELASSVTADGSRRPLSTHEAQGATPEGRLVRLVEARSGRPLVGYAVRAAGRLWTSDAEGSLRLPAGVGALEPVDDPRLSAENLGVHGPGPAAAREPVALQESGESTLALEAGPSFALELAGPAGFDPQRLEARLSASRSRAGEAADLPRLVAPLRPASHGVAGPWVRFAPLPSQLVAAGEEFELEVRDDSGTWRGRATVESPLAGDLHHLSVELTAVSVVEGRVRAARSELEAGSIVALRRAPSAAVVQLAELGLGGEFAMRWVEPGPYELVVDSPSHAPWSELIEVRGAERLWREIELEALEVAGPIAGRVTSESGTYAGQLLVFLLDAEGGTLGVYPTTWRDEGDGELAAAFEFAEAPPGELRLDVVSLADAVGARIEPLVLRAPRAEVEVRLLDLAPRADWSFDVVDAATGAPIERYEVELRVDGGRPRSFRREPGAEGGDPAWTLLAGGLRWNRVEAWAALRGLSQGARLTWTVRAEGFADARGDQGAFEVLADGRRLARVESSALEEGPVR